MCSNAISFFLTSDFSEIRSYCSFGVYSLIAFLQSSVLPHSYVSPKKNPSSLIISLSHPPKPVPKISIHLLVLSIEVNETLSKVDDHMQFLRDASDGFGTYLGNQECGSSLISCLGFVGSVLSLGQVLNVFLTMSFRSSNCQMALEQLCKKKRYFWNTTGAISGMTANPPTHSPCF